MTLPTPQSAFFNAFLAAASVLPFSAGTLHDFFVGGLPPLLAFALPLLIVSATFAAAACVVPAAGLLEITSPFGTVEDAFLVTVPSAQLAAFNAVFAAASVSPARVGTTQCFGGGPLLSTRFTFVPAGSSVPATGLMEMTSPLGTVVEACWVIVPAAQLAFVSAVLASESDLPTTVGTSQTLVLKVGVKFQLSCAGPMIAAGPESTPISCGHLTRPRRERAELVEAGLDSRGASKGRPDTPGS